MNYSESITQHVCALRMMLGAGQKITTADLLRDVREDDPSAHAPLLALAAEHGFDADKITSAIARKLHPAPAAPGCEAILPSGFSRDDAGSLFFASKSDDAPPRFIAGPHRIIGGSETMGGTHPGTVLEWQDRRGRTRRWIVDRARLHGEPGPLAAELAEQGMRIGTGGAEGYWRSYLAAQEPQTQMIVVEAAGWHRGEDGASYVMPDGTATTSGIILRPALVRTGPATECAGTLAQWNEHVAALAVGNSRLVLCICTALAGALLHPVGMDSGGVHVVGRSQTGKSTGTYMAGSVWGKGSRDGVVGQWRATDNGMESIAKAASDGVLILDEIAQAPARSLGEMLYMLANGAGKARSTTNGGARDRASWRVMLLSTGEVTVAAKMAEVGLQPAAGIDVRLLNVTADAGRGLGAFEDVHGHGGGAEFSKAIKAASARYYGTAARAFVSALAASLQRDEREVSDAMAQARGAMRKGCGPCVAEQVGSALDRFAIMAAAGELAVRWGVLSAWCEGEATKAMRICAAAWLQDRGGDAGQSGEEQRVLARVGTFLAAHGTSRFDDLGTKPEDARPVNNRAGWRQTKGEGTIYYIIPAVFDGEVCGGIDPKFARTVLDSLGLLVVDAGKKTKTIRVPGHGTPRVVAVRGEVIS